MLFSLKSLLNLIYLYFKTIGASASLLLLSNGDILGFSGIISTGWGKPFESTKSVSARWKLVFLGAFALTANIYAHYFNTNDTRLVQEGPTNVPIPSTFAYIISGFLVGLGTKLGNGCTSGHGICGLSRYSKRSFAAVMTFLSWGIITATIFSPKAPWSDKTYFLRAGSDVMAPITSKSLGSAITTVGVLLAITRRHGKTSEPDNEVAKLHESKTFTSALAGVMAAYGLAISGMIHTSKVVGFLDFGEFIRSKGELYDPTLITVLCSAVLTSWISYQFVDCHGIIPIIKKPFCSKVWSLPKNTAIDSMLIVGETLFGIGWGIAGLCPGPALFQLSVGVIDVGVAWMPAFLAGSYIGIKVKEHVDRRRSPTI